MDKLSAAVTLWNYFASLLKKWSDIKGKTLLSLGQVLSFFNFRVDSLSKRVCCTIHESKQEITKAVLLYMYKWQKIHQLTCHADKMPHPLLIFSQSITKTCLYNFDPLKPHFYIVKLGFAGVYIIFLISAQNIDCGYSLEPPRRGGSNEYPQSMF